MADFKYKKDWRGRIIFKNIDEAHKYWLTGYRKGKLQGLKLAFTHQALNRKARLAKKAKIGATA